MSKKARRYIVFKEDDTVRLVGLEFNIVEQADDPQIALFNLFEAMKEAMQAFKNAWWSSPARAQSKAAPEYEDLWQKLNSNSNSVSLLTPSVRKN